MGCCSEGCCEAECCNGLGCCDNQNGKCTCGQNCCCAKGCTSSRCCENACCAGSCSGTGSKCCGDKCDCCGCCGDTCTNCGCCGTKGQCGSGCKSCGVCGGCGGGCGARCKACGCCDDCCSCCASCCPTRCQKKNKADIIEQKNGQKVSERNHVVFSEKGEGSDAIQHLESVEISIRPVEDVVPTRAQRVKSCCKKFTAFLFSTVGLSCLMVAYTIFGGFIFMNLEGPNEIRLKHNIRSERRFHVKRLWELNVELNVFHEKNWSRLAEEILEDYTGLVYEATKRDGWDGKDGDSEVQWTFAGSMLYSITVVTTIGYGHIAPKTNWGRLVTILYAILGIPLTLLTITNLGGFMASAFRFIYKNICCGICCICCEKTKRSGKARGAALRYRQRDNVGEVSKSLTGPESIDNVDAGKPKKGKRGKEDFGVHVQWKHGIQRMLKTEDNKTVSVPIYISLLVITCYILLGAALFALWEDDWDYLIGSYFCFITLTTIGFGDYVPGTASDSWANQEKLVLCALYLIIGLSLIAMCFDLMQEEARNKCRALGRKLGLLDKEQNASQ